MPDFAALIATCVLFAAAFAYLGGCERLGGGKTHHGDQP